MRQSSLIVILSLCVTAGVFTIAPDAFANIIIGQGIAHVKLGDSQARVEKAVGRPGFKEPPNFEGLILWKYPKGFEGGFEGVIGFDRRLRVNDISTFSKRQKTSKGVGPGSRLAQVRRTYPGAKCSVGSFGPQSRTCIVKAHYGGRAVKTMFVFVSRSTGMREVEVAFG